MKKTIFLLLSFQVAMLAQVSSDRMAQAFNAYKNSDFGTAYLMFKNIVSNDNLAEEKLAMAKYYEADCLLNLNQLDGAAEAFESFIDKFRFSNLREYALYKLGTIYYTKTDYRRCRDRLQILFAEYPNSQFAGSAYYWMGEAYFAENKFLEAEENFKNAVGQKETNKYLVNTYYSLGQLYEKTANYTSAVTYYDELLAYYKDSPLAPESQMRIGVCYFNLKQYDNAILELSDPLIRKLTEERLFEAKVFLANSFIRLQEYSDAARVYNELLPQVQGENYKNRINYNLAWIDFQLNDYNAAYKKFKMLADSTSDSLKVASLYWSGECKRYLGDSKAANEIFSEFVAKYPSSPLASRAQLGMGSVMYKQSDPADAEKALMNATISSDKATRGKAYTLLGEMRLNKKDYDNAKNYFSEALKLTDEQRDLNNRARLGLAVVEFYSDNYEAAISDLEKLKLRDKEFESDKVNFYLAECYFAQGKYSEALKSYSAVAPSNDEIRKDMVLGKAYTYFNLKDFPNAIFYFNEFVSKYKNDPNTPDAKLRLADSYFGTKKFDKASALYREIFSRAKVSLENDHAYYQYAQSLYKADKPVEAVKAFEELQKKFPRSRYADQSQYVIGWIFFQQNNFAEAISNYKNLLTRFPRSALRPMVHYSIGDAYFNLAQYDSSIAYYSGVISRFPNSQYVFDAVNGIQYCYVAQNQPDRAIAYIDQYVSEHPSSAYDDQIFFKKGDLYYSIQKYNLAVNAYQDFISKYPNSKYVPSAYYWIGKSASNMKNDDEALRNFQIVIQRSQKSDIGISAVVELVRIYSARNQFDSAIKLLQSTIAGMPNSNRLPELLYLEGTNQEKNNKPDDAYSTFEQIVNYSEGNVFSEKAKIELGLIEMQRNNLDKAAQYFSDVAERRPDDIGAQAQYYSGVVLFNQNKITDAITALVRVRSVYSSFDEWYTKSLLKLGDCYVKMKDKSQARDMYRAVLSKHPTGDFAQEARKKLRQL